MSVQSSCVPNLAQSVRTRTSTGINTGSVNVGLYQGRVLADNPIILSNNTQINEAYDLNKLLSTTTITSNSFLKGNGSCNGNGVEYCFEVRENKQAPSPLQTSTGKWSYNAYSPEFLQVNTFYHLNKEMDLFFANLTRSYERAYLGTAHFYDSALPRSVQSNLDPNQFSLLTSPFIINANCDEADAAYFDHTTQSVCLGYFTGLPSVKWAQDSTVIYHETGHFYQKLLLNLRNSIIGTKVDMGTLAYDEAGAIGEGLSDYYSYYVNGRTHFAEWAAGRFLQSSRPMSERDALHVPSLSTDPDQRLSYPQYIDYNPNDPTVPVEDVHYSGMVISHYLVALTEDLVDKCAFSKRDASDYVVHLISETLAEHGDLTSKGTEFSATNTKINLNATYSADWFKVVNPITYRSFMQTMAKNLKNNLASPLLNRCNGGVYSTDQIESLIDQYGLLLFRTYNENRNDSVPGTATANTLVNSINRKKSVLVSKNLLTFDPATNASSAYIIDNRDQIRNTIAAGHFQLSSTQNRTDLDFNNNNGRMSPGEVVAVAINLYNNSNTPMGGVQILANDWNHADATGKPCRFPTTMSNDQWPLISEGGVPCTTTAASTATDFAPVCFMQSNSNNATTWVSQQEFKTNMALDKSFCLDPNKPNECYIRAVKGADQSVYSKLNSKSTWGQTLANPTTGAAPVLGGGNIILFEVSKQIPPGTIVDCRLRVRFTNCEDCYHDPDRSNYDFTDTDYNGPKPFKVIHLQIPIID